MTIEQEITFIQFAQGHLSIEEALDRIDRSLQPGEGPLYAPGLMMPEFEPNTDDVEQALAESAVNVLENPSMIIRRIQPDGRTGQRVVIPGVHPDDAHRYMLYLFKATYGRYRPAEMTDKPEEWRFWDLSQPEVVRDIIQRHQQRVEALYANPEYYAEFESLARLTRESETLMKTKFREPEPVSVDEKDFVSYDTLMTSSLRLNDDLYKNSQATYHLLKALTNAVSRQYELDTNTARRLVSEVSARHYQEKYGPGQPSDDQRL